MMSSREEAIAQLNVLGFTVGTRFYGRGLLPRELQERPELRQSLGITAKSVDFCGDVTESGFSITPYKWIDTEELKADGTPKLKPVPDESRTKSDGFNYLTWLNRRGYGIYFYPNKGGRFNREITHCQSAYFESDEGSFEQQWQTINQFKEATGLAPTAVVKTRKSLHVYYRFNATDWSVEGWTEEIQRPLALTMKSDPAIQNTARLMRLAGFQHVKWDASKQCFDFVAVSLEICDDKEYSRQQIKDAIAGFLPQPYSEQRFKLWVYLNSPAHKDLGVDLDPELARTCPGAELDELDRRWRRFIKMSRDKINGKAVDPDEAFNTPLGKLPKSRTEYKYEGAVFEGDANTILWSRFLYGYNPVGRGDWITAQDPLIPEGDRHAHSIDSLHIHKTTGAIKSHRGSDPKDIYEKMRELAQEGIWRELTELSVTPWKTINTRQLNLEELGLERGVIYIIKSAKGTHKTNSLKPLIPTFTNVYGWFNRIALGREECHRIGLDWKDDLKGFNRLIKVGFCSDSSYQFNPGLLRNNGLLIADECDQVFDHNFGDTCNKDGKRPLILASLKNQLGAAIAGGGMAIFMSADIADKEVEYIKALAPEGCPVRVVLNEYKPQLGDIYFDNSETPDGQVADILQKLEAGEPCYVIDDVKNGYRGCKSIAEYIRKAHPEWRHEIVEINSDTSGDPTVIAYLKNINQASLSTKLLAVSPSVVSGISIENKHFKNVYGFNIGVLVVNQMSQAIARNRGVESINLWVGEKGLVFEADRSLFPEQIKAYYQRNYEQNARHILAYDCDYNPLTDEWSSPHFDLFCKNAAYRNCCMVDLRNRMRQRLIDEGYQVIDFVNGGDEATAQGLKDAWNELEINHAHAVAGATVLTDEQLRHFEDSSIRPNPQQLLDIEKTFLLKTYGQELIDAMVFEHKTGEVFHGWSAMVLRDDKGKYRKQLEAFHLLQAGEGEAIAKDLKGELSQLENGTRFAGDVRWRTRQRKARIFLGLDKFLKPDQYFSPIDFADMATKAKKHCHRIKDALGLDFTKMNAGQIFGELVEQIGLKLDKSWAPKPSANGRRCKTRTINRQSWEYAQMYVRHKQATTQDSVPVPGSQPSAESSQQSPFVADHPPLSISYQGIGGGDQGLRHTQEGVDPDQGSQNVSNQNSNKTREKPAKTETIVDTHPVPVGDKSEVEILSENIQRCQTWGEVEAITSLVDATTKKAIWRSLPAPERHRLNALKPRQWVALDTHPKVGDRVRVNLPGFRIHGLQGVLIDLRPDEEFPCGVRLEVPEDLRWLEFYEAKTDWLEASA